MNNINKIFHTKNFLILITLVTFLINIMDTNTFLNILNFNWVLTRQEIINISFNFRKNFQYRLNLSI